MKKLITWFVSSLLILAMVFALGRYGWKLMGFRACQGAGIESVTVEAGAVQISGFYPGSFPVGFCGYYSRETDGKLYVGFRFSPVFGFFETGDFDITIPVEGKVESVILKTGKQESLLWTAEEPVSPEELVGPWHLAEETDMIYNAFPGAMEYGSAMEIRSDGAIAWGIGADGAVGIYTMEDNVLHCEMMNVVDDSIMTMEFTARKQDGQLFLTTVYRDIELRWRWGEGETGRGE